MAEQEQFYLGCSPISEGPANVPGVIEGTCRDCGIGVWISPSSTKMMAENPLIVTVCVYCAFKRMKSSPEEHDLQIHPLQLGELLAGIDGHNRRN